MVQVEQEHRPVAPEAGGIGPRGELPVERCAGEPVDLECHALEVASQIVHLLGGDRLLPGEARQHLREVAVGVGGQDGQHLAQDLDVDVDAGVDPSRQPPVRPLEAGLVDEGVEVTVGLPRGHAAEVLQNTAQCADAGVEALLEVVEVAAVFGGDGLGDVALCDPVHVGGGHVQGRHQRVEHGVHALDQACVVALVTAGIGPVIKPALQRRGDEAVEVAVAPRGHLHELVEAGLDPVEVAQVLVDDGGRGLAPCDGGDVAGGDRHRTGVGVHDLVHSLEDRPELASHPGGVAAIVEPSPGDRVAEGAGLGGQRPDVLADGARQSKGQAAGRRQGEADHGEERPAVPGRALAGRLAISSPTWLCSSTSWSSGSTSSLVVRGSRLPSSLSAPERS